MCVCTFLAPLASPPVPKLPSTDGLTLLPLPASQVLQQQPKLFRSVPVFGALVREQACPLIVQLLSSSRASHRAHCDAVGGSESGSGGSAPTATAAGMGMGTVLARSVSGGGTSAASGGGGILGGGGGGGGVGGVSGRLEFAVLVRASRTAGTLLREFGREERGVNLYSDAEGEGEGGDVLISLLLDALTLVLPESAGNFVSASLPPSGGTTANTTVMSSSGSTMGAARAGGSSADKSQSDGMSGSDALAAWSALLAFEALGSACGADTYIARSFHRATIRSFRRPAHADADVSVLAELVKSISLFVTRELSISQPYPPHPPRSQTLEVPTGANDGGGYLDESSSSPSNASERTASAGATAASARVAAAASAAANVCGAARVSALEAAAAAAAKRTRSGALYSSELLGALSFGSGDPHSVSANMAGGSHGSGGGGGGGAQQGAQSGGASITGGHSVSLPPSAPVGDLLFHALFSMRQLVVSLDRLATIVSSGRSISSSSLNGDAPAPAPSDLDGSTAKPELPGPGPNDAENDLDRNELRSMCDACWEGALAVGVKLLRVSRAPTLASHALDMLEKLAHLAALCDRPTICDTVVLALCVIAVDTGDGDGDGDGDGSGSSSGSSRGAVLSGRAPRGGGGGVTVLGAEREHLEQLLGFSPTASKNLTAEGGSGGAGASSATSMGGARSSALPDEAQVLEIAILLRVAHSLGNRIGESAWRAVFEALSQVCRSVLY